MVVFTSADLQRPEFFQQEAYIDGAFVSSSTGQRFDVVDPGNDETWASMGDSSPAEVDAAVASSLRAFHVYRKVSPHVRAERLFAWDALIKKHRDDIARILVAETGKPLKEAHLEIDYATSFTWFFAGEAERIQGTVSRAAVNGRRIFTVKSPLGVVGALVPWNFPIAMILRKVGAALAAGCTVVCKPSPETPMTTLVLALLASEAGFEPGVFNVIPASNAATPAVAERMCKHPDISKITFTGSTPVGKLLTKFCAEGLKKVTLELGGNAPFIVFDDADLDAAVAALLTLKWRHAGQACITANRVYVQRGVYEKFAALLTKTIESSLKVGYSTDPASTLGPVTTMRGLEKAVRHVEDAVKLGAKVQTGGRRAAGLKGYFFEPTVLTGMTDDMLITSEETFAPVAGLYAFDTEEEVVKKANNTTMGLASYFFTRDVDRTFRLLDDLEAGMIGMNTGNSSAAEAPFGGIKESGYGKESGKDVAVAEYLITKTGTLTIAGHY